MSLAGALIRVYFVARHTGSASPIPVAVAGVLLFGVAFAIAPRPSVVRRRSTQVSAAQTFAQVQSDRSTALRELSCGEADAGRFPAPPAGVAFDTPEQIVAKAVQIHQQAVVTKVMPVGNLTQITDDERALLDRWFKAGGKAR